MTPARSMAASVVALGFASTLTAPMPAFANPAPCQRVEHYAAQAGAQILRINRLDLGPLAGPGNRRGKADHPPGGGSGTSGTKPGDGSADGGKRSGDGRPKVGSGRTGPGAAGREGAGQGGVSQEGVSQGGVSQGGAGQGGVSRGDTGQGAAGLGDGDAAKAGDSGGGLVGTGLLAERTGTTTVAYTTPPTKQSIGGVGLGDSRTVLIADGPVKSAAAARLLDGRVAGSSATNDLVVQQTPPNNAKPAVRRTDEKRFGPLRAGSGELTAHARWDSEVECAAVEAATSAAELDRITLAGAGNGSLLRVPEKIVGLSSTGLREHDGRIESVASATMTAGRISLADGQVRIRVLRAPGLRVSMPASGAGRVDYRPAVVEVSGRNIPTKRLETVRDHVDVTLSDEVRELETPPTLLEPSGPLPLPPVEGLPELGEPETSPAPAHAGGAKLRISLGDVRQAAKDKALAARVDAIKVALVREQRPAGDNRVKHGYRPSSLVADLGIGLLEGAAVAPRPGSGVSSAGAAPAAAGPVGGAGAGAAGLPITGPRTISIALGGVALLLGGIGVVLLTSRKRRMRA